MRRDALHGESFICRGADDVRNAKLDVIACATTCRRWV